MVVLKIVLVSLLWAAEIMTVLAVLVGVDEVCCMEIDWQGHICGLNPKKGEVCLGEFSTPIIGGKMSCPCVGGLKCLPQPPKEYRLSEIFNAKVGVCTEDRPGH